MKNEEINQIENEKNEIKSFLSQLIVHKNYNLAILTQKINSIKKIQNIEDDLSLNKENAKGDDSNSNFKSNTNKFKNKFKSSNKNKSNNHNVEKHKRGKSAFQFIKKVSFEIEVNIKPSKVHSNKEIFNLNVNVIFDESYICISDLSKNLNNEAEQEINQKINKNNLQYKQIIEDNNEILSTLKKELNELEILKKKELKIKKDQLSTLARKLNLKRQLLINKIKLRELNIPLNESDTIGEFKMIYFNCENDNLNNSFDLYNK